MVEMSSRIHRFHRWAPAASFIALGLVLTGCPESTTNPIAPGVEGVVRLGEGLAVTDEVSLEIRFYPRSCAGAETLYPETCDSFEGYLKTSVPLSSAMLPHAFELGPGGQGATSEESWLVMAWLSRTSGPSVPAAGELYGISPVTLLDCSQYCSVQCFCGRIRGIEVLINAYAQ
jgi:hypothetical protein